MFHFLVHQFSSIYEKNISIFNAGFSPSRNASIFLWTVQVSFAYVRWQFSIGSQSILYPQKKNKYRYVGSNTGNRNVHIVKILHVNAYAFVLDIQNFLKNKPNSTNLSCLIFIQISNRFLFILYFPYAHYVCIVCESMSLCRSHWCRFSLTVVHLVHSHVFPYSTIVFL